MLEEVGGAVGLVGFGAADGIDPDADGGGLSPWRVFGSDLNDVSIDEPSLNHWKTDGEAVAQGGCLGFRAVSHRSREASL